jgi:NAD-dependent dihydropyrimidine dehydrogenase PreA subunit
MGVMLFTGAALFSKLFCAYICPLGTISEWLGKLGDKWRIKIRVSETLDSSLRALKYIVLFITFYFTLTSSELFCKKFDPYYAVASGFGSDVVMWYAIITIVVLIVGSVLFRFFWCRYLCPFGALTNIFRYFWWFAGVSAVFILLSVTGLRIHFMYPLLVIICAGYILEILMVKRVSPSLTCITRNTQTCTNCNLCTDSCPQEIDVAKMERVTHIDCNLCGDCLYACPEKDTLQINRRNMKWLPGVILALLIVSGILMGSLYELPTINVKWGSEEQLAGAGTYTKDGLKNIKCFGSSTAFANKMREVEGVYGVSTYVGTNTVKVLYNQVMHNDTTIQKLIFVPQKRIIKDAEPEIESVAVYTLLVDQFFDPFDANYLQYLLQQNTPAYSYQSEFSCPVTIRIYFPAGRQPEPGVLADLIESEILTYKSGDDLYSVKLNYRVVSVSENPEIISRQEYIERLLTE